MARAAWLADCGRMAYADAWALQRALVADRQAGRIGDVVLLVEHPPVFTIGRAGRAANILIPRDLLTSQGFEVFEIERGGDVTYHGPGQLVGYPILNLEALDEDVVRYVRLLESTLMRALGEFGITGARVRGYPGVWVGDAKIAAIGVAVKRRVTMHGFALNVDPDLGHFGLINACGLGKPVTSMARLLRRGVGLPEVRPVVARSFAAEFDVEFQRVGVDALRACVGRPVPGASP